MKPQASTRRRDSQAQQMGATSPWTEPYQTATSQHQAEKPAFERDSFASEDQRPTHDALSDIYNRNDR